MLKIQSTYINNEYISSILTSDSVKKYYDGGTWYHIESFNVLCPDG